MSTHMVILFILKSNILGHNPNFSVRSFLIVTAEVLMAVIATKKDKNLEVRLYAYKSYLMYWQ